MERVLVSWVAKADFDAAQGQGRGIGPVAQAVDNREFDRLVLLSNYGAPFETIYKRWLKGRTQVPFEIQPKKLSSPTHLGDIYRAVTETLEALAPEGSAERELTFHTSPGTPPMAAIWIILACSRYPAKLLTSSIEHGVAELEAPFDLAADFVTHQVARFGAGLTEIAEGRPPPDAAFAQIHYKSAAMVALIERAQVVAALDATTLLEGESGTGKELLARAIHQASQRRDKPFVAVNCGAIPRELVQSSLFGHAKGAFSGATSAHAGYFRDADGGTLFLDEIGELPLEQQVHLLRVLQERKVTPVGATRELAVDVRIVAATHRNLREEVAAGRFREDLYYRLATLVLRLPALRERSGDLPLLIDKLMPAVAQRLGTRPKRLSARARTLLMQHVWPGNVRELEGTLARALAWARSDTVEEHDAREALLLDPKPGKSRDLLNRPLGDGFSLEALVDELKAHYLTRAQEQAGGVKKRAADLLGFEHYQTYDYWLKNHLKPKAR